MSKFAKGQDASTKMRKALELRSDGVAIAITCPDDLFELKFKVPA